MEILAHTLCTLLTTKFTFNCVVQKFSTTVCTNHKQRNELEFFEFARPEKDLLLYLYEKRL